MTIAGMKYKTKVFVVFKTVLILPINLTAIR